MASFRYRAQIPAEIIGAKINTVADKMVFSKPLAEDYTLAKEMKSKGSRIIVDFCDDHFERLYYYKQMAELADKITCCSKGMQDVIKQHGFDAEVINDPYEYLGEPHANGGNLIWFGHQSNIAEVMPFLQMGVGINVVTGQTDAIEGYTPWSVENLGKALTRANIALIPDGKPTRSNNRLVNAIAAGCFVVAGEQHRECRQFVWANKNIAAGFQFAKCFQDELNDMVREGQKWVQANYAPDLIAKQWNDLIAST